LAQCGGVFLTLLLASALVFGSGTLMDSGMRSSDPFSPEATVLPAMMGSFGGIAVMLAVLVVSQAFAAALRDRRREFALLRAVGATGGQVRRLISTEVFATAVGAIPLGAIAGFYGARALVPLLRTNGIVTDAFTPVVSYWALLATVGVLLPAAWIAGRLAAREMASLSPSSAVSTASADARTLGKGRLVAAAVCAVGGLVATSSPFVVPGAMGGATGAASAFLFITAVALAGPALVLRGATWLAKRRVLPSRAAAVLATANSRGYSRRVTAAVVPLALLISLGSVQSGMGRIAADAAAQQLGDGITADFVWQADPSGETVPLDVVRNLPGVSAVAASQVGMVQVEVDSAWEASSVRSIELGEPGALIDPDVSSGDLQALANAGTVAAASDSLMFTGKGLGDQLHVRYPDGTEAQLTVVAIYQRGLGLGGLIVGSEGFEPAAAMGAPPMVLISAESGQHESVVAAAAAIGITAVPTQDYVDAVMQAGGDNALGDTLLLVLLAFIAIAAGNALVIATRARSKEFEMLGRIGATKGQLRAMLSIEATLVAIAAVGIGTLTAVPGLTAASLALVRGFSLGLDITVYAGLAAAVVVVAFLGVVGARLKAHA
jgi:putative ABC transport system permease protein